jgi:hypothetical protein
MLVLINRVCYYWLCANVVGLDLTVISPKPKVVGSTPAARTSLHSERRCKTPMESMVIRDFTFSIRLFHVDGNMGEITVKPEHKPEQRLGTEGNGDFGHLAWVLAFWVKSIRTNGHKSAPDPLAQQDDLK